MNKKYIIIVTFAGVLITTGVVTGMSVNSFIDSTFTDPMDEVIFFKYVSTGQFGEALKFMDLVRQQELERQAMNNLSPEEKAAGYQEMMAFAEELARKNAENPVPQPVFHDGIFEVNSMNPSFKEWQLFIMNEWKKGSMGAVAGYYVYKPSQGVIAVMDPENLHGKLYETPTAMGPVRITAENNGVLTLVSVPGTYDIQEPGSGIKQGVFNAPGVETYYFDLSARTFK